MTTGSQLILIRHSIPEIVQNLPAREWSLSAEGRRRAKKLAERLAKHHPEVIFSSMEPKAQQTAKILGENLNLKLQIAEGLHEHERKEVPFHSKEVFRSLVRGLFEKPDALVFGEETGAQALERFRKSVDSIMNAYSDKKLAIVSHGTVISLFVSWMTGVDGYALWEGLGLPSFVVLDIKQEIARNSKHQLRRISWNTLTSVPIP